MANDTEEILNPAEVEALLNLSGGPGILSAPSVSRPPLASAGTSPGQLMSAEEIDAFFEQYRRRQSAGRAEPQQEQAVTQRAVGLPGVAAGDEPGAASAPRPFEFPSFDADAGDGNRDKGSGEAETLFEVQVELGRTTLPDDEIHELRDGSLVILDQLAADPVDIVSNGRVIARGELLVLHDKFCVRIAEILAPAPLE